MLYILLAIVAVLLCAIYEKLKEINQNFQSDFNDEDGNQSIALKLKWLVSNLNSVVFYLEKINENIDDLTNSENPAGPMSLKYKRLDNLAKIYAKHLTREEKLNEKDALAKARFSIYHFGDSEMSSILQDINWGLDHELKEEAEKEFYSSGVLEKDIKDFWTTGDTRTGEKWIAPYDLFAPIYDLIVKQEYDGKKSVKLERGRKISQGSEISYYSFVKNRAIVNNLEKIGVLKKINKDNWSGKPKWILENTNLSELKNTIYKGEGGHDDSYFEERFNENDLERIFKVTDDTSD